MDLVQKIFALVAAVRASDWPTAIRLTLEIITLITQGLTPQPMFASSSAKRTAMMSAEAMSMESIATELETNANASGGPAIAIILPLLIALIRKLLGF